MTVFVDNFRVPATVGRIKARWSHLSADTVDELHEFAARIGMKRSWFQTCKRNPGCQPPERCVHFHYDVVDWRREQAIKAGAVPIDLREWASICAARRRALREADA